MRIVVRYSCILEGAASIVADEAANKKGRKGNCNFIVVGN